MSATLSRKGNCPYCQKALRNGRLYLDKGVTYHFRCVFPPLPLPSDPMPHTRTRHAQAPVPPHDAP